MTMTAYKHTVLTPSGMVIAPFREFAPVSAPFFEFWVEMRLGLHDRDYRGYRYRPERTNPWQEGLHRIKHTLHSPHGTTIEAPFGRSIVASTALLHFWIDNGMPDPGRFGRTFITVDLMTRMMDVMAEHNVATGETDYVAILLKMRG